MAKGNLDHSSLFENLAQNEPFSIEIVKF